MAINVLATETLFQRTLDKIAIQEAATGWMDANAGQVIYHGGKEVKLPKMTVDGMADYDRDNGYVQGGVTLEYETHTMTQDRGRKFQLDAMDVDETGFVATAASVMGEFQRVHVIPEIDAYRISKLAKIAIDANVAGMIQYGKDVAASGFDALKEFKEGIKAIRDMGYNGPLVAQATSDFITALELQLAGKIRSVTFAKGGINTQVPAVDDVPFISTPSNRMYTAITIYDGKTEGQKQGGYVKGSTGKNINFMLMPRTTPIAVTKQDKMKIFTPDQNQDADAWKMNYRRFHDLWVLDNKANSLYMSVKQTK